MKVPLYILGFLSRYGPQHGYRLKHYLEHVADFTRIKLPTIYYHLGKMEHKGLINASQEKEGKRPEKWVYTLTDDGHNALQDMLKDALTSSYRGEFLLDSVLYFNNLMEVQEVIDALTRQISELEKALQTIEHHKKVVLQQQPDPANVFTNAIFSHHEYHNQAELKWLQETVDELRKYIQKDKKIA